MAFSFGAPAAAGTPAAPAPAFGFGAAPAPATTAPAFGAPAQAPAAGTSLFGAPAAAPAGGGLFGAPAPAPSGGGGLFGAKSPAPAATGGLFGTTPAAAPAGGGLFGAPAAAPAGGGLFGSTAPAPAAGGGFFGSTPAPASGGLFGAPAPAPTGSLFGAPAAPAAAQPVAPPPIPLSGNTPYAQLPDGAKRAVDQIYQLMMQHRRTVASVKTMAPSLLTADDATTAGEEPSPADAAAGSPVRPRAVSSSPSTYPAAAALPRQTMELHARIQARLRSAEGNLADARQLKATAGEAAAQAKMHGAWPVESVAARRGVALSNVKAAASAATSGPPSGSTTPGGTDAPASAPNLSGMANVDALALQQIMDIRAARVDRVETMPSPYLWEVLRDFEQKVEAVQRDVRAVGARLAIAEEADRVSSLGASGARRLLATDEASLLLAAHGGAAASLALDEAAGGPDAPLPRRLAALARSQSDLFLRVAARAARAHEGLEEAKLRFRRHCEATGRYREDPFVRADVAEIGREREVQRRIAEERLATAAPPPAAAAAVPGAAAPAQGGLFGAKSPAPAGGSLFGAPAPAAGGSLFGAPVVANTELGGSAGAGRGRESVRCACAGTFDGRRLVWDDARRCAGGRRSVWDDASCSACSRWRSVRDDACGSPRGRRSVRFDARGTSRSRRPLWDNPRGTASVWCSPDHPCLDACTEEEVRLS
ncbi:hypothetical protein ACHAXT_004277 [Thalassiosira profunda]